MTCTAATKRAPLHLPKVNVTMPPWPPAPILTSASPAAVAPSQGAVGFPCVLHAFAPGLVGAQGGDETYREVVRPALLRTTGLCTSENRSSDRSRGDWSSGMASRTIRKRSRKSSPEPTCHGVGSWTRREGLADRKLGPDEPMAARWQLSRGLRCYSYDGTFARTRASLTQRQAA